MAPFPQAHIWQRDVPGGDEFMETYRGRDAIRSLDGDLHLPETPHGLVVVVNDIGEPETVLIEALHEAQFGTLELAAATDADATAAPGAHVNALTNRTLFAADWIASRPELKALPVGIFGAQAGGEAALAAASRRPQTFRAVVSRAGQLHLAGSVLESVHAPTLLIADGHDDASVAFNQDLMTHVKAIAELEILRGLPVSDEGPGTVAHVARLARRWFARFLS